MLPSYKPVQFDNNTTFTCLPYNAIDSGYQAHVVISTYYLLRAYIKLVCSYSLLSTYGIDLM